MTYTLLKENVPAITNLVKLSLYYQLLITSITGNDCSESFEIFTEMPLYSGCYLHYTIDYFVCSVCRVALPCGCFLCNARRILGIVNLRDTSVWLFLKCSNLLMKIILITVFCKLYVFRQKLDNFNISVESLYGNMLHD